MKYLYSFFLVILFSCSKNKSSEFAEGKGNGIVGRWKLVELQGTNAEKENYYISFDANGNISASDFSCLGDYTFDQDAWQERTNRNLLISFKNCSSSSSLWYSVKTDTNARLVDDNNTLVFNSPECDEGCGRLFKRLK